MRGDTCMTSFACVAEVKLCKFHFESNKSEYSLSLLFFYVAFRGISGLLNRNC